MSKFDDQYRFSDQDRGYRSDEVRGPTREAWASQPAPKRAEPEESAGGGGGHGTSQNPAWAGQSASLQSDVAGRGSYGSRGAEGSLGYGQYEDGGPDSGEGRMPSSRSENDPSRGRSGRSPRPEPGPEPRRTRADSAPREESYGTRHWGHGEYRGDDGVSQPGARRHESMAERVTKSVGNFFGIGPKGYRRSDARITEDVCETLQNHHEVDASEIEVNVKDGVVNLTGTVDTRKTRRMIEDIIDHLPGIQEIENHLRTKTYVARTEAADQIKTGETSAEVERPTLHS